MKRFERHALLVIGVFFLVTINSNVQGQTPQGGLAPSLPSASSASYYYIAKPGELTMQVNLWGFVKNPGRYEVSSSTDLVQLISFAGGPNQYAKLSEVKITRSVGGNSTAAPQSVIVNLENLEELQPSELKLYPGDTIYVDYSAWITIRDTFSVFTTVAIITTAIAQLINVLSP